MDSISSSRENYFSEFIKYNRLLIVFLFCWIVVISVLTSLIYANRLIYPPLRSDAIGYYMYLPAVISYGDITATSVIDDKFRGSIPSWTGVLPYGKNKYIIKYTIGWAILVMPFYFLGYIVSWLAKAPLDGFSMISLYFVPGAGMFYAVAGALFLWLILRRFLREKAIMFVMCLLVTGTPLLHYATFDSIFSHIHSFFLITLLFWLLPYIFEKEKSWAIILAGLISGLIIITRITNAVWLIAIPFYGVFDYNDFRNKLSLVRIKWPAIIGACIMLVLPIFLQILYWHSITGNWIYYSYGNEGFNFLNPHTFGVLFSVRAGMYFWTPLLFPATIGFYCLFRNKNPYFTGIIIGAIFNLWIISSWRNWFYGGFSLRPITDSIVVLAIGLAAFWKDISPRKYARYAMIIMILCCVWTIWLMIKYWLGIIPFDGVTFKYFSETFFSLHRTPEYWKLIP